MTVPRISVVVPFFNVEDLLGDCLASIAAQTMADLQVIMVDDGSSDGSAAIAAARAAADPRFTLASGPGSGGPGSGGPGSGGPGSGGPGGTRNRGVELATGTYLAFADADDIVPPHAYERMLHTLEAS